MICTPVLGSNGICKNLEGWSRKALSPNLRNIFFSFVCIDFVKPRNNKLVIILVESEIPRGTSGLQVTSFTAFANFISKRLCLTLPRDLRPSGICRCVTGLSVPDVSSEESRIFRGAKCPWRIWPMMIKPLLCLETLGASRPVTKSRISEERRRQLHRRESLKIATDLICSHQISVATWSVVLRLHLLTCALYICSLFSILSPVLFKSCHYHLYRGRKRSVGNLLEVKEGWLLYSLAPSCANPKVGLNPHVTRTTRRTRGLQPWWNASDSMRKAYWYLAFFCSFVRLCGTNFAQNFKILAKLSCRIWRIISMIMCS